MENLSEVLQVGNTLETAWQHLVTPLIGNLENVLRRATLTLIFWPSSFKVAACKSRNSRKRRRKTCCFQWCKTFHAPFRLTFYSFQDFFRIKPDFSRANVKAFNLYLININKTKLYGEVSYVFINSLFGMFTTKLVEPSTKVSLKKLGFLSN